MNLEGARWKKSSRSTHTTGGNCVEVAVVADGVAVRDSKNPDGGVLAFTYAEWRAFTEGVKLNEFDV